MAHREALPLPKRIARALPRLAVALAGDDFRNSRIVEAQEAARVAQVVRGGRLVGASRAACLPIGAGAPGMSGSCPARTCAEAARPRRGTAARSGQGARLSEGSVWSKEHPFLVADVRGAGGRRARAALASVWRRGRRRGGRGRCDRRVRGRRRRAGELWRARAVASPSRSRGHGLRRRGRGCRGGSRRRVPGSRALGRG